MWAAETVKDILGCRCRFYDRQTHFNVIDNLKRSNHYSREIKDDNH